MRVFISYSSKDHDFVLILAERLRKDLIDVWIADWELKAGDSIIEKINRGLEQSSFLIIILSEHSIRSDWVLRELNSTLMRQLTKKDIKILPVLLEAEPEELPPLLSDIYSIKFSRDVLNETQYHKLIEPIRKKVKSEELTRYQDIYFDNITHVDMILDKAQPTRQEVEFILNLIKNGSYKKYFFRKVTALHWFNVLKKEGYFKPSEETKPREVKEKGSFSIPIWDVLFYLEVVSQKVNLPGNEKYINELLSIIEDVSSYKDAKGKHIDNYRTRYYFIKILQNLPKEKITEEIIDLIPIWLDSKFGTMLPGSEIVEKLLPIFLKSSNPEDWKKAERIIEIVTDIKWVEVPEKLRDIYGKENEPRTLVEPYWLKEGIEKHFERIGEVCSTNIIEGMARRILAIFSKRYQHSYDVSYEGKDYQITHSLLENGEHQISVYSLKFPEDWDGFSREKIEKTPILTFKIIDFENKAEFVAKVKENLVEKRFTSLSTELDEPILSTYSLYDYSYVWYSSLSDTTEHENFEDAEKILTFILKEILAAKARANRDETIKVLKTFLSGDYPYPLFKRLVLFVASRNWDNYKEYFFKTIDLEGIRIFEESDYEAELAVLIKDNFRKFSSDEKGVIKKIIETGPEWVHPENPEKYKAYWRQKWLYLLKEDPFFTSLYEAQKKLTDIEKEEFSYGSKFRTSVGFGPSPLTKEEILNLANADLAIRLKEFRSEKKWEGMTVGGFSIALKGAAITNPAKFTENLCPFQDVGFIYIYKMLDGFKDAWKKKKVIDWAKIFSFVSTYTQRQQFWNDEYIVEQGDFLGGADHDWVTGIIAELIEGGTRDDLWAFSEEYNDEAKQIIFHLLRKPEENKEITDYLTYAWNTPCGKLISALVNLALRIARMNDKKGIEADARWSKEYKNKFDEILNNKIIEAYTLLGHFLPNLYYIDKNWVVEKIEQVSTETGGKYWEAFMDGYLSIARVYDELYQLMKPHYQYGLSFGLKNKHSQEHLVQHICIGYLRGQEGLDDSSSLFRKIVDVWRPDQIKEIIGFFWMQRYYLEESSDENQRTKEKIISFWRRIYEGYKGKVEKSLSQEDKKILSSVSRLAVFLPQVTVESNEWLMLSATHVHEDFNSSFFIEYLDKLKDKGDSRKTAEYIGEIYLEMLKKITPDYDKKHIRSIIEFLYNSGAQKNASKICNIYGPREHEFLRDIYEKYSASK